MNATSGTSKRQKSSLQDIFAQWKAGASVMLEPMKERLVEIPSRLIGIHDLVKDQREDIRQLGEKLALINGQVLRHLSPNSNLDAPTMKLLQELINVAADAEELLEPLRLPCKRLQQIDGPEKLANLDRRLSSLMLQLSLSYGVDNGVRVGEIHVRMGEIGVRIDALEREASGSLAGQISEDLLLAEIPPAPVDFHGRDDLVESIVELTCRNTTCRIPLLGPGGIGKTSVAAAVINNRRVRAKYGRRIVFLSCEGLVTAEGILSALAACLHVPPGSHVRRAVFTSLLSHGCILLVLDNLETAWDSPDRVDVEQLLSKLAELSSLSLLVTMRGAVRPAGVDWAATCMDPITPLSLDAARQLWMSIARHHDDNADRLLNRLDGLPLAITLMAHQGQLLSPTDLLEAYDSERTALVEINGGDRLTSLDVSIRLSIQSHTMSQNTTAAQLLSLLSLLPEGITISDLPKILPTIKGIRKSALALIAVALAVNVNGRLRALSPVRDFVMEQLPPSGISLVELRAHYMLLADEAEKLGTDQWRTAIGLLSAEFGNINSVLRHSWKYISHSEDVEPLHAATDRLSTFSHFTRFGDCLPLLEDARKALECMGHHGATALYTLAIGNVLSRNHYKPALEMLQNAKAKFEDIGDRLRAAQCMKSIGGRLLMLYRYDDALSNLEQAKAEFETIGDRHRAAQCVESIGITLRMVDRYDDALSNLEQAKMEFETMGDRLGAAQCMKGIGDTLRMLHRYEDALSNVEQAKVDFERIGDRLGVADCTKSIGDTLRMLNRYDDALSNLEQAKTEFETIGDPLGAAQCMQCIGETLGMLNRYDDALLNLERAKAEFETIGGRLSAAQCMQSIGEALRKLYRYDDALSSLEQAKVRFETIGKWHDAAKCMQRIGKILRRLHRYDAAKPMLEQAKAAFEVIGNRLGTAECGMYLGYLAIAQGDSDRAEVLLMQSLTMYDSMDMPHRTARCRTKLAGLRPGQSASSG